jgi:hypothetical protein
MESDNPINHNDFFLSQSYHFIEIDLVHNIKMRLEQ